MKRFLVLTALLSVLFIQAQNEEIDRLTVELTYQNQDSAKVDTSLLLISKLIDAKNYTKAFLYVNQTLDLAKTLSYSRGLAEANYYKAVIYNSRDDYFNAIDNYNKSLNFYFTINDSLGLARVSSKIGLLEIERGNYQQGLGYSLAAISTFEQYDLQTELSSAYNCLAEAYLNTNNVDKALEYNEKALMVRRSLADSSGIKISTVNIAKLYSKLKEHRKAIEYYKEAIQLLNPETDGTLLGEVLPRLGSEYLIFKEYDLATKYLLQGLRYNRNSNNSEGLAISLNGLGNLNYQRGKLRTAESQLLEAYAIADKSDLKPELLENYLIRIQLDSTRGYFQNAFKWQSAYYELRDTMTSSKDSKTNLNSETTRVNPIDFGSVDSDTKVSLENPSKTPDWWFYGLLVISFGLLSLLIIQAVRNRGIRASLSDQKEQIGNLRTETKSLKITKDELEESNQVKDKLFSIVSHDLKDSISSIKAFLDLLREDSISKEEFNELIPELSENANNASALLFNLLNWSKSQLQSLEPKPEMFNIQEVFRDKMDLVEQKVEEKSIILIDESERDFVYADKSMIEIVIQNLITNAVKFSRNGDMITISNIDKNGKSLICVEDTGVGISDENLDKLFNAANNFTTRGTKNEKGTGLGLSIAKDLVELNQGKIWVESTLNVGSKFFIELPKAAPQS
ncbi:ATP-binding protein [Winogradskyella aurantiaca]|uniref:ATP-binding protein n=1 Tax=Winogradskyella aurantiaca TaxID=2219558 RepID=UPI000E1E1463|nr:ATP-binding protein [Winogradskyella aurantiaca]